MRPPNNSTIKFQLLDKEHDELLTIEPLSTGYTLHLSREVIVLDLQLLDELAGLCFDVILHDYYSNVATKGELHGEKSSSGSDNS